MAKSRILTAVIAAALILTLTVCNPDDSAAAQPGASISMSGADYSDAGNWLRFGGDKDNEADVFIIYPTVTMSQEKTDQPFIRLNSEVMRTMAAAWLEDVEGLFDGAANIYAPFYRQLNASELNGLDADGFIEHTNRIPRGDIFAAFDYYLKNENGGRPFILFGHSQGAQLVIQLAAAFLGSAQYIEYNKSHIASYAIGYSVTESQIKVNPELAFSRRSNDVGVIMSWNATSPSEIATEAYKRFGTWLDGALVTNPISWRTNELLAHASQNPGSRLTDDDGSAKIIEHYANALVDNEHCVLITYTPDEAEYTSTSERIGKFHRYDIAFFYESIKQNIKDRINAFLSSD
ncbi:MAG: DUF3089 domain-containing protein [Clostridiales bacterium]|jgi:pimeloyl-ACP methyl ester carboxylesterase|nr:DUF3089 domain-containing protein [Clostridiales bacterium]